MSKTNDFENQLLLLIFNNDPITLIGDALGLLGSAADGNLYLSLHTADAGEAGNQSTNEIAYTGYARVAVARTTGGFVVTGNQAALAALQSFPAVTGAGGAVATNFGVGTSASGTGKLLYKGTITNPITCNVGVTPQLTTGLVVTEE
jgi:hypothetical protein